MQIDENSAEQDREVEPIVQSFINASARMGSQDLATGCETISDEPFSEDEFVPEAIIETNNADVASRCSVAESHFIAAVQSLGNPSCGDPATHVAALMSLRML